MCRFVENYLETPASNCETLVVALYFSAENRDNVQSLQAVLAFIVETMLHQRPQSQKYYNRLMLTGEGPLKVEDCLRIIHRARQDFQSFYVLIDALDECDAQQAQEIVERLMRPRNPIKVFATSRQGALTAQFSDHLNAEEINNEGVKAYIRTSLEAKMPVVSSASRDDSAELHRVTEEIFERSNGRFVLAKQILCQLPDVTSAQEIDQILHPLPSSLEQLFALTIQQISEQAEGDAKLGRRVLSELLAASRELMTAERLLDAVAADAEWETTYDQVWINERVDRCVHCCRGLVTRSQDIVCFVHLSVLKYLQAHGISNETQG